jgi:hypothetical protein
VAVFFGDQVHEASGTASQDEPDGALWNVCARGDTVIARLLLHHDADLRWAAP